MTFQKKNPGRPRGSRNKRSLMQVEMVAGGEMSPLQFFLALARGEKLTLTRLAEDGETVESFAYVPTFEDRRWGAERAAPFVHAKLAAVEHSGGLDLHHSHEDWLGKLLEDEESSATDAPAKGKRP